MPGMDDEPTTTFTNLSALFSKLGISEVDGGGEEEEELTWREKDSERLRQALKTPPKSPPSTRSWRDRPSSPKVCTPHTIALAVRYIYVCSHPLRERVSHTRKERP